MSNTKERTEAIASGIRGVIGKQDLGIECLYAKLSAHGDEELVGVHINGISICHFKDFFWDMAKQIDFIELNKIR